jgi:DNA polymerase III epsilon subunit-like protein
MYTPLGLDIETSTGNPSYGMILSIGAYDSKRKTKKYFYEEIRHTKLFVEPQAFAVNKIDITTLSHESRISLEECDDLLSKWIGLRTYSPLGFNVGSFDMKFIERLLPLSSKKLGYRTMDLNAICMFIALKYNVDYYKVKTSAKKWSKDKAIDFKPRALHGTAEYDEHHALFDAVVAVNCLLYLNTYSNH